MQVQRVSNITGNNNVSTVNHTNKQSTPAFSGWGNLFKPKKSNPIYARLDSDIRIYSQKELERLRQNVALEISEIMDMSNTPGLTKRLDDLLHSPFVNYEPRYIDNLFSLADKITFPTQNKRNTETYRQFVLSSLSETMPLEILDKNQKKAITTTNEAVKKMLYDYTKMDESTPQAAAIRKMVKRLGENDIPVNNSDYYLAMSITHKKPLMSKTYIDTFNISPAKNIPIATRDASRFYMIKEAMGNPEKYFDNVFNYEYYIIDPEKIDSVFADGSISLYKLAGLSDNKEIREIFNIPEYLKNSYFKISMHKFNRFINESGMYHPELFTLDYIEKYLKAFEKRKDFDIFKTLDYYPRVSARENPSILNEIDTKISLLQNDLKKDNTEELAFLTGLRQYVSQ